MAAADATPRKLAPEALRWHCDPAVLGFATTAEVEAPAGPLAQTRAVEAIELAVAMPDRGFNLFALGSQGLDKHDVVRHLVETEAAMRPVPDDWCYVNNFDEPHRPHLIRLPPGRGRAFRDDLDRLVEALPEALRAAFQTEEYTTRRQMLEQELKDRQEQAFGEVETDARARGIAMLRTPMGLTLAPMRGGKIVQPDEFDQIAEDDREKIEKDIRELQQRLQEAFRRIPDWMREAHEKLRALNEETADYAVGHLIAELQKSYADIEPVGALLDAIKRDIIFNVPLLLQAPGAAAQEHGNSDSALNLSEGATGALALLRRYRANLIVDNDGTEHAPVVYEDEPSYDRLVGRIEHRAEMGALVTDLHLIRPGALHRANGGFLLLDARKVLTKPFVWEALKRALRAQEVRIETLAHALGFVATVSLEPDPVPLDIRVALIGDRMLYYMLSSLDPEFQELFKIAADFDEEVERSDAAIADYARMVAALAQRHGLRPHGADAVARVLEHGARVAGDQERLTMHVETIGDVLREADFRAGRRGSETVDGVDVEAALDAQERRSDRVRNLILDEIRRGTILIDSDGGRVGQINGLAVLGLGGYSFGRPSRITARVHLGRGDVVDIDREVELGGPIHAKGVLILGSFLKARYALHQPLSLGASLVFEQSYGGIEGDSASVAELCALLSAIAEVPIDQSCAVTGSVNQHGEVQAIGGVNEKIEGFFDVCAMRGLTGRQAVLIPASNVKHLMLARRVIDAVAEGKFEIVAIGTVDQAIERLTGKPAGGPGADGRYPEGSVNRLVEDRLAALAERRRAFAATERQGGSHNG